MTFKQVRIVFDDGKYISLDKSILVNTGGMNDFDRDFWTKQGYGPIIEIEDYLNAIAAEGWVLHTAIFSVLGKQECHYFLFVKE